MSIAYLFAGQGAQSVGMGRELYNESPAAREIMDKAQAMQPGLLDLMFTGPAEQLNRTLYTQLAVLTLDAAAWADTAPTAQPAAFAGFSLGEYAALVAAEALSFERCFELVRIRARLMDEASEKTPGGMAAILGMQADPLEKICAEQGEAVWCANYNCPGQIVISGQTEAVQAVCDKARAAGAKVRPLPVSGAFHSPMMQSAADAFAPHLSKAGLQNAKTPLYSNVTAQSVTNASEIAELLTLQIVSPVRFEETLRNMKEAGVDEYIELGPGKALSGFVKRTVQ